MEFGSAFLPGDGALFAGAGDLIAFGAVGEGLVAEAGVVLGGLFADGSAGGEIGEALEGEELVWGVVLLGDEEVGGGHDGVVDVRAGQAIGGEVIPGGEGVEVGKGEFFAVFDPGVDEVEFVLFVEQALEWAFAAESEAESTFCARLAGAFHDNGEGLALGHAGELFEFVFGE